MASNPSSRPTDSATSSSRSGRSISNFTAINWRFCVVSWFVSAGARCCTQFVQRQAGSRFHAADSIRVPVARHFMAVTYLRMGDAVDPADGRVTDGPRAPNRRRHSSWAVTPPGRPGQSASARSSPLLVARCLSSPTLDTAVPARSGLRLRGYSRGGRGLVVRELLLEEFVFVPFG